ncbi:MAG: hypothetical protein IPJ86_13955 [Bacteroidetes bacterium]|jgi:ABC-type uncharacterized transport system permease subunit|nr:hypothetical protein [Bacteroidota bacterium]
MKKFKLKDNIFVGILLGAIALLSLYFLLTAIDIVFLNYADRPFFIRPDSKQLLLLATLIILFRNQIKEGEIELAKGFFLTLFCSVLLYLVQKKTNFALW